MIDKQKLLQWVEDKLEAFGPPYDNDSAERATYWKGVCNALVRLKQAIELREFEQE